MEFPKLYTEFARYYDRLESQYRDYALEAKWLEELLVAHGSQDVIDVSCGTGSHAAELLGHASKERLRSYRFIAMDASKQMVEIAQRKTCLFQSRDVVRADFLDFPFVPRSFDAAICMYWSLAGLDDSQSSALFRHVNSILKKGGLFVFDVENADGIKENVLDKPFIDSFFQDEVTDSNVIRVNLSRRVEPDAVNWTAYYIMDSSDGAIIATDRMKLRFYHKIRLEEMLSVAGFRTMSILSSPFLEYSEQSPSLYFVAEKTQDA